VERIRLIRMARENLAIELSSLLQAAVLVMVLHFLKKPTNRQ
jgi:hypothetical protein